MTPREAMIALVAFMLGAAGGMLAMLGEMRP